MTAQCVMIWLHAQRSAQPMLLVVQEQHTCNLDSGGTSVLFPV